MGAANDKPDSFKPRSHGGCHKFFEFIEVKPSNTDATQIRRRIRSHAARAGNNADGASVLKGPTHRHRNKRAIVWPLTVELANGSDRFEEKKVHEAGGARPQGIELHTGQEITPALHKSILVPFVGNDTVLPISHSRLYPLPFLSLVLNNYLRHLAVAIPEVDGPIETGLLKKSWFPMVLHNKILFQIIVLFSASHYASHQDDRAYAHDILLIKQCALRDLQEAVRSKGGFNKDENIAAVGKLASYEAIFGTEEAYHVHMNALEQMLNHRGGLSALGMNGFLARLLIFIDTNSAFLLNTKLHLTESSFPRKEPWIPPNPSKFIGSS